jgi:hypothetical protein
MRGYLLLAFLTGVLLTPVAPTGEPETKPLTQAQKEKLKERGRLMAEGGNHSRAKAA